LKLGSA